MNLEEKDLRAENTIRRHWKNKAVLTDAWRPDEAEQEIPENELQAGEMSAVILKLAVIMYAVHGVYISNRTI